MKNISFLVSKAIRNHMSKQQVIAFFISAIMLLLISCTASAAQFTNCTELSNNTTFQIVNQNGNTITVKANDVNDPGDRKCWGYAQAFYQKVWGVSHDTSYNGSKEYGWNYLRGLTEDERAINTVKSQRYISAAPVGAVIRVVACKSTCSHFGDDTGACNHMIHSFFLAGKDENGCYLIERPGGSGDQRKTRYFTWSQFNSYCQTWLKCYWFKYIKWPGARSITMAETPMSGYYYFNKNDEARFDPYDNYSPIVHKYSTGDMVEVVASVVNTYGNIWYKLTDGSYVYSGDVEAGAIGTPTSIEMNYQVYSLNLTETLNLSVTAYPDGTDRSVTWTSSNENVVSVSSTGVVTPHKAGETAYIIATSTRDPSLQTTCQVTTYYSGSGTLKFNGVKYPHTYVIGKSWSWPGTVESDVDLAELTVTVYTKTSPSNQYTYSYPISSGTKSISMSSVNNIFSNLKTSNVQFWFYIYARDSANRAIGFINGTCKTTTSGSHVQWDATGTYQRPQLKASMEYSGNRYELYSLTGRDWATADHYAKELGGHLVTFTDESEFNAVATLCSNNSVEYISIGMENTGGYWHWQDGTPFTYTPWHADVMDDSSYPFPLVGVMNHSTNGNWYISKDHPTGNSAFVVEYEMSKVEEIILSGNRSPVEGDTVQLIADVLPTNAKNKDLYYVSSDTTVATVNQVTGLVQTIHEGNVTITAYAQDGSSIISTITLNVLHREIPVTGITISVQDTSISPDGKNVTVYTGQHFPWTATIAPSNADNAGYIMSSSDESVAYVSEELGEIIPVSSGYCTITATTLSGGYTDTLSVTVLPAMVVAVNAESFPDDAFRSFVLESIDTDDDEWLNQDEIDAASTMWLNDKGIASLAGIEYFTHLQYLYCWDNQLTELDISQNTALRQLYCYRNQLTVLDVSHNPLLEGLSCNDNQLTTLDVSNNTALTWLEFSGNQISTLDISNNTALINLYCSRNQLTELDVSHNTGLTELLCWSNQLTTLDVSPHTALRFLDCSENLLTTLDVSNNTALTNLSCSNNHLTGLNISNNTALTDLYIGGNPFNTLNISNNTELKALYCFSCQLTELDVSNNANLQVLDCDTNQLSILNLSSNPALTHLYCNGNQLTSLDVENNNALVFMQCSGNQLSSLDVSNNTLLEHLACTYNRLTSLDLSSNTALQELYCANNQWTVYADHIDLSSLAGFNTTRASNWTGAMLNGSTLYTSVVGNTWAEVQYTYDCGQGYNMQVTLEMLEPEFYQSPGLLIPESTERIETEAFYNTKARTVKLPENVAAIGSKAFAACTDMTEIYIPEICTSIASDAFLGDTGLVIYGQPGSYAGYYASQKGFAFVGITEAESE